MCNKMRAYLQRECALAYLVEPRASLSGRACLDEHRARLSSRVSRSPISRARLSGRACLDEPRAYSTDKHEASTSFSLPWRLSLDKQEFYTRAVPLKQDLPNTQFFKKFILKRISEQENFKKFLHYLFKFFSNFSKNLIFPIFFCKIFLIFSTNRS